MPEGHLPDPHHHLVVYCCKHHLSISVMTVQYHLISILHDDDHRCSINRVLDMYFYDPKAKWNSVNQMWIGKKRREQWYNTILRPATRRNRIGIVWNIVSLIKRDIWTAEDNRMYSNKNMKRINVIMYGVVLSTTMLWRSSVKRYIVVCRSKLLDIC